MQTSDLWKSTIISNYVFVFSNYSKMHDTWHDIDASKSCKLPVHTTLNAWRRWQLSQNVDVKEYLNGSQWVPTLYADRRGLRGSIPEVPAPWFQLIVTMQCRCQSMPLWISKYYYRYYVTVSMHIGEQLRVTGTSCQCTYQWMPLRISRTYFNNYTVDAGCLS